MVAATDRAHENTMLDWLINRQFNAIPSESPYLKLTVRRDKLIQDTLTCLAIAKPSDFRKLLRVSLLACAIAKSATLRYFSTFEYQTL